MGAYVIDASVAIKWLIDEEGTHQAIALRRHTLSAPDLLLAECANILWKKVHLGELSGDEAAVCARLLGRAELELVPGRAIVGTAVRLATYLNHPAYDSCISASRRPGASHSSQRMPDCCASSQPSLRPTFARSRLRISPAETRPASPAETGPATTVADANRRRATAA